MKGISSIISAILLGAGSIAQSQPSIAPASARGRLIGKTNQAAFATIEFGTNLTFVESGQEIIASKLVRIHLRQLGPWDDMPLSEVVNQLGLETKKCHEEGTGVNFLIKTNSIAQATSLSTTTPISPTTGLPSSCAQAPASVDVRSIRITIDPSLTHIRLVDALDAICAVADQRIDWSVEDHTIVFSPKAPGPHPVQLALVTRPGTRLILDWSVFTNGVLDTTCSRTRTYGSSKAATTNVVSLGLADGSIIGIPGGPIPVDVPVNEVPINDVAVWCGRVLERGLIPASRRGVTLIDLTWNNGGDAGINSQFVATRRGRVVLKAKVEPMGGTQRRHTSRL